MTPTNHAAIARITATHCCVCRKELTDAESVELGLGPVCSRRYYDPLHQPTEQEVKEALGLLAVSGLPDRIVEEFVRQVNNDRTNARQGCNLLVYWASCHYHDREEVFKCSAIIRALGYTKLAEKLETDRTVASIRDVGDRVEVFVPDQHSFRRDLMQVSGIVPIQDTTDTPTGRPVGAQAKVGSKLGWSFPKTSMPHFECILGIHYGGDLASTPSGVFQIPRHRRWELDSYLHPAKAHTGASHGIRLTPTADGHRIEVHTPFMAAFKDELKLMVPWKERTWTGSCWEVDLKHQATVTALIQKHFGVTL